MARPKAGPHWTIYSDLMQRTARLTDAEFRRFIQASCDYVAGKPVDTNGMSERLLVRWEDHMITLDRQLHNQRSDRRNGGETDETQSDPIEPKETQWNPMEPNRTQSDPSTSTNTNTNTSPVSVSDNPYATTTTDTVGHAARTILHASTATVKVLEAYAGKFREGEAIVLHAMNEAAASGDAVADPQAYTIGILKRYEREGVQTLVEAAASDHKGRTSAQATGGTAPRAQDYQQRPYTGDQVDLYNDPYSDQT